MGFETISAAVPDSSHALSLCPPVSLSLCNQNPQSKHHWKNPLKRLLDSFPRPISCLQLTENFKTQEIFKICEETKLSTSSWFVHSLVKRQEHNIQLERSEKNNNNNKYTQAHGRKHKQKNKFLKNENKITYAWSTNKRRTRKPARTRERERENKGETQWNSVFIKYKNTELRT
jgi:adenylate kinase family enzyme